MLSLTDNELEDLPDEIVNLRKLGHLKVDGNPFENIPETISGGAATFQYISQRARVRNSWDQRS